MGRKRRTKTINRILSSVFDKGAVIIIDYYGKREYYQHNGNEFKAKALRKLKIDEVKHNEN